MTKNKEVAKWMEANGLTSFSLAAAISYSPGAVAKWRQEIAHPEERALRAIERAGKRRGWSPFPVQVSV